MTAPVSGGTGDIAAYLFGASVWDGQFTTCGQNQTLNIMDIVSLTVNGLACPLAAGAPAAVSLAITVPSIASGLTVDVIMNATAQDTLSPAFCLNLSLSF